MLKKSISPAVLIILVVIAFGLGWISSFLNHATEYYRRASFVFELEDSVQRELPSYYERHGRYPESLVDLRILSRTGAAPIDFHGAAYLVEGPMAWVVLSEGCGPTKMLAFKNGKFVEKRWINLFSPPSSQTKP